MSISDEHAVYEKALHFLVTNLQRSSTNKKTVGIHSVLVAMRLHRYQYSSDVVAAALLHDLVEDTDVTTAQIKEAFGERIARLVDAVTFEQSTNDYAGKMEAFEQNLHKIQESGDEALAVRAADFVENSLFYDKAETDELRIYLRKKFERFMEVSKPALYGTLLWNDLQHAYEAYVKHL